MREREVRGCGRERERVREDNKEVLYVSTETSGIAKQK